MKTVTMTMLWVITVVICGGLMFDLSRQNHSTKRSVTKRDGQQVAMPRHKPSPEQTTAWSRIQPQLKAARQAGIDASDKHYQRVSEFFAERKKRTRAFAEAVLSLRSKWQFVKSKLPSADREAHRKYLRDRFEETVFSSKELEELLRSVVEGYVQELRGMENELLVKIRADLADGALADLKADARFRTDTAFRGEYAKSLEAAASVMAKDLKVQIGREVVTWVGADIATTITISVAGNVATRFGVSAAILSTGAASTVATLGVGVAACVIIDALMDWIFQAVGYDPAGDVRTEIDEALEDFEGLLLFGDKYMPPISLDLFPSAKSEAAEARRLDRIVVGKANNDARPGLVAEMLNVCERREKLRSEALRKLILEGGQ